MSQLAQRLIMAAGGAKKDSTYVEDVFSTYLYHGNDNYINVDNNIKLSNANFGNSVNFNGVGDNKINIAASADFAMGSGDFTWEAWVYHNSSSNQYRRIICTGVSWGSDPSCGLMWDHASHNNKYNFYSWNIDSSGPFLNSATHSNFDGDGLWHHVAVTRSGNTYTIWVDGVSEGTATHSGSFEAAATPTGSIGACFDTTNVNECWAGNINDVRITKGQALYTTNFTPSTESLTTTSQGATGSNVKLLCCNGTTASSATVTPNSLTVLNDVKSQSFGRFTGKGGKGGLVWIKNRDTAGYGHFLFDTKRGTTNAICSNLTNTQFTEAKGVTSFNNSGFNLGGSGGDAAFNSNSIDYASWTYAIQEGFFDIQTWDGNNTAGRQLPHNLGSVPGCIMVKSTHNNSGDWMVYHREIGATHRIKLNSPTSSNTTASWNDVVPTSTHVTLGSNTGVNASGTSYVGYFFAGGASTADTARSVYFGGDSWLIIPSSSDLTLGTGDFTIETWVYPQSFGNRSTIYDGRSSGGTTGITIGWEASSGQVRVYMNAANGSDIVVQWDGLELQQWQHIAVTRSSGTVRLFINGTEKDSATRTSDLNNTNAKNIGYKSYTSSGYDYMHGQISNFRLVKGTALYTSSFRPSTEPLTNITNTKLLCCQNTTVTGATVTPGTITSDYTAGGPTIEVRTTNPFDDLEGYKFGEGGDQNLIKTGRYVGNENANGPEVYLGWEPQFIILKPTSGSENWGMWDSMRGIVTGGDDMRLLPNGTNSEITNFDGLSLTPTGFKITSSNHLINPNATGVVYIAIRRPDGLVGKPAEVGTDVFAMDNGSGTTAASSLPTYTSGFPVDWGLRRIPTGGSGLDAIFISYTRLLGLNYLQTVNPNVQSTSSRAKWDLMTGFNHTDGSSYQAWMWKRGAGFDAVTYTGTGDNSNSGPNSTSQIVAHSLGKSPEMIWVKCRSTGYNWYVYHSGQNGGTNPWNYYLSLNAADAEQESVAPYTNAMWNNTAPTSTHFSLGPGNDINANNDTYIALLFASVDGISKCGYYDGSTSEQTITTGFQPKFVIIKNRTNTGNNWTTGWFTFDTRRGWAAGNNDKRMRLNDNADQTTENWTHPIATGFVLNAESGNQLNNNGEGYVYYAHA